MQKLKKQTYITKKEGEKTNNYYITIPKKVVAETNITEQDGIKVYSKNNKIIIEKGD